MLKWFRRKQKETSTANTFVEATGGGWGDAPDVIASDGGTQVDFVKTLLEKAAVQAKETVEVGEYFDFIITDIPRDILGPHEILFGLIMQADNYGLSCEGIHNETAHFTRIE